MTGVTIKMYLADGTAEGLRIIEKSNWNGRALECARADWPRVRSRADFAGAGVYVLVDASESALEGTIYIGEADPLRARLNQHLVDKDFWTRVVAFTSNDLNKAHVKYLEARLIRLAHLAKTARIENGNIPGLPSMSESDKATAEAFLADMLLIYPLLGVRAFGTVRAAPTQVPPLILKSKGIEAHGRDTPEGFVVYKGSLAAKEEMPSLPAFAKSLRGGLLEWNILVEDGATYRMTQDYVFNSPSTALMIVLARSGNGRLEWRDSEGRTLKALQEEEAGLERAE